MSEELRGRVPRELLQVGVAIAGSIGIVVLWAIDLLVYHVVLVAHYEAGKLLEKSFTWLPPVRRTTAAMFGGPAVRYYLLTFYLCGAELLLLVGGTVAYHSSDSLCAVVAFGLAAVALAAAMIWATARSHSRKRTVLQEITAEWQLHALRHKKLNSPVKRSQPPRRFFHPR